MAEPVAIVREYYESVWMGGRDDLIPNFCADPVIRHDLKGTVSLSHAQQKERIKSHPGLVHRIVHMHGDDTHVTMVFEVRSAAGDLIMAGIEVLKLEAGKIVENWTGIRPGLAWDA